MWVRWNGYRYDDAPDEEDEETEERSRQGEIGSGQIVMEKGTTILHFNMIDKVAKGEFQKLTIIVNQHFTLSK